MVDLCGQHEHQRLLDAASHVEMVDAWAGAPVLDALAAYRAALAATRAARDELARVTAAARTEGARLEDARFALERIDEVDPQPGELEELEETLPRAEHSEALASTAHEASEYLSGEGGALDALNAAIAELSRMGRVDAKLSDFADALNEAAITLEDVSSDLRRYRDGVDFDPAELARLQERHAALRGLMRQFGPRMEDVLARREEAGELIAVASDGEARIRAAQEAVDAAEAELSHAARTLMRRRNDAAPRFCREVGKQMARLEMGKAELVWDARELPRERWSEQGPAACELLYRGGAGLTARPLRRIASGGELSRVMLACKVVLGEATASTRSSSMRWMPAWAARSRGRSQRSWPTSPARTRSSSSRTWRRSRCSPSGITWCGRSRGCPGDRARLVEGEERVHEVARMLSGDATETSLAHAREMLQLM